jgi:hypothetical protein
MKKVIAQIMAVANRLDDKQEFELADKLTKIAQQMTKAPFVKPPYTKEDWLYDNAFQDGEPTNGGSADMSNAPEEIQREFELDMAEKGIHHDYWPDTWNDWCAEKAEHTQNEHHQKEMAQHMQSYVPKQYRPSNEELDQTDRDLTNYMGEK